MFQWLAHLHWGCEVELIIVVKAHREAFLPRRIKQISVVVQDDECTISVGSISSSPLLPTKIAYSSSWTATLICLIVGEGMLLGVL
ncbi:hypothetical protein SLA2020_280870 [Shorea laevis]